MRNIQDIKLQKIHEKRMRAEHIRAERIRRRIRRRRRRKSTKLTLTNRTHRECNMEKLSHKKTAASQHQILNAYGSQHNPVCILADEGTCVPNNTKVMYEKVGEHHPIKRSEENPDCVVEQSEINQIRALIEIFDRKKGEFRKNRIDMRPLCEIRRTDAHQYKTYLKLSTNLRKTLLDLYI